MSQLPDPPPPAPPSDEPEVIRLEDLVPRSDPRGGARKLVFGEETTAEEGEPDPARRGRSGPGSGRLRRS